jgi:hypothetical protein
LLEGGGHHPSLDTQELVLKGPAFPTRGEDL